MELLTCHVRKLGVFFKSVNCEEERKVALMKNHWGLAKVFAIYLPSEYVPFVSPSFHDMDS